MSDWQRDLMEQITMQTDDIIEAVDSILKDGAKELADKIRDDAPTKTGKYKNGWKVKKQKNNEFSYEYIVYNANKPGLTHLLENGHLNKDGTRTQGTKHINDNAENVIDEIIDRVEEVVK